MSLIECNQLTKSFRKGANVITPLKALDLTVEAGAFLALMGPSGSGKTTLLNLLAGIDRPTSGELKVAGADIARLSRGELAAWRGKNVGYVFQLYNLVPVLTAYENVELPLLLDKSLSRRARAEKVAAALAKVNMSDRHDHYPRQLSGGQEQRVAIARAIVHSPLLIVADEPTGDLDKESAKMVMELFTHLNRDLGMTILMVTHDPDTALYARELVHLDKNGRLTEKTYHAGGGVA